MSNMNELAMLRGRWQAYRQQNPGVRIRTAAHQLEVSEAELVQTGVDGTCVRLESASVAMVAAFTNLGKVMALTRSDALVHEVKGAFGEARRRDNQVTFLRPGQDTRYFLNHWVFTFAVQEGERHSLQFFDRHGHAIHKIFLQAESNLGAYQALTNKYRLADQTSIIKVSPQIITSRPLNPKRDINALRQAWSQIQNVHEGNRLVAQYQHTKAIAYEDLGTKYARQLTNQSIEQLLTLVAAQQHPIMLFGMSAGAIQSYAGTITKLVTYGPWFNVLDTNFNIHLMPSLLGQVWHIRKPSKNGIINTLSALDQEGNEIMVITDHRQRGQQESKAWYQLIEQLDVAVATQLAC